MGTIRKASRRGRSGAPAGKPQAREMLADLAELVLTLAREMNLRTAGDRRLVQMTATEINVMRYVHRHPGLSPKMVAREVGLKQSNFSVALNRLRDRRMIAVVPDPHDGRSRRLLPTDLARRNLTRHRARWAAFLEGALPSASDVRGCVDVLARMDDALGATRRRRHS